MRCQDTPMHLYPYASYNLPSVARDCQDGPLNFALACKLGMEDRS